LLVAPFYSASALNITFPIGDDPHAVAIGSGVNTSAGCRRIAEYAFEYAVHNGRKKVTIVHIFGLSSQSRIGQLSYQ
jgi:isocitrate/isopropylmalate dehydrogenase